MNEALPFAHTWWYEVLRDGGSFFAGVLALIAGIMAYRAGKIQASATRQAAADQIAVNAKKDRLQAHCIAVGIHPELLAVRVSYERASKIIRDEFPKGRPLTAGLVDLIHDVRVVVPPLLSHSIDQLYVLGEAGATILQLLSVVLQYNYLVDTLAKQIADDANSFNPSAHQIAFSGHLQTMALLIAEADQQITPIQDELPV